MNRTQLFVGAALAALAVAAHAADNSNAQPGDPARWYVPAETAAQKYQVAMKEAGAALGEALKECRSGGSDRRACESEARALWRADVAEAKSRFGSRG